jgi:ankyrin repeat protein
VKGAKKVAYAIGRVHFEAVRSSLEVPAGTERPGESLTALMRAAMIGRTDACMALLDRDLDVNCRDRHGRTPLLEAIYGGHADTVRALLDRGADPNAADTTGWTPLMEAASKGHYDSVKLLVENKADVRATTRQGWTALKATAAGNYAIVKLLKEAGAAS